jgi:adenosine deaminase
MTTTARPLASLPKAHLHLHLEGAMRPSTLAELCRSQGTALPVISARYGTFADFQELYLEARHSLRTVDLLVRLVGEVVADAAADGAVWIEPAVHLPGHRGLGTDAEVLDILVDAGRRATEATGVGVGWLLSSDRTLPPELALDQATLAAAHAGDGVVSFGLANDEAAGAPEPFGPAFAVARAAGIISAPHAGEHGGPDSVRGALDALGADRIQHGVRCVEDSGLVGRLADEQICLDVCPTSNVALSVVPALQSHPLPRLLDAGVPCSINADDPLLFGVGLLDEYIVCRDSLGLDDSALASCARASVEHSGAPPEVKAAAVKGIDDWLRS